MGKKSGFIQRKGSYKSPKNDPTEEITALKTEVKAREKLLKEAEEKMKKIEEKMKKTEEKMKKTEEKLKKSEERMNKTEEKMKKKEEKMNKTEERMKKTEEKMKKTEEKLKKSEEKLKEKKTENLFLEEEIEDLKAEKIAQLTPNPKAFQNDESSFEHFFMNKILFKKLIHQVLTFYQFRLRNQFLNLDHMNYHI